MVRIATGRALIAVPIYLPDDPGIPARGVPASARFSRPFEREKRILQREAVGGPAGLSTIAYLLLAAIVAAWLSAFVLGMRWLQRNSTAGESSSAGGPRPPRLAVPRLGGAA
jgi:hypothetical protein